MKIANCRIESMDGHQGPLARFGIYCFIRVLVARIADQCAVPCKLACCRRTSHC